MKEKLEEISRFLNYNTGDAHYYKVVAGHDIDRWESNTFIEIFRTTRGSNFTESIIKYYYGNNDLEGNIYRFLLAVSTDYIKRQFDDKTTNSK